MFVSFPFPQRGDRSATTDVFARRPIFGMSHGLANTALALSPFTADAEVQHQPMRWIKIHPMQKYI